MILLEHSNRILADTIQQRVGQEKKEVLDITFSDFDGVSFHVSTPNPDVRNIILISLSWRAAADCLAMGGKEDLANIYGPMLVAPESGYDVTLQVDLDNPIEPKDKLALKISNLKRHVAGAPFKKTFDQILNKSAPPDIQKVSFREGEAIYLKPEGDRCTVIFSVSFKDADDAVYAKVFLQELADSRKTMNGAPAVKFTYKELPLELENYPGVEGVETNGFISMVLFAPHMQQRNAFKTISLLESFRNYLHYHIKCSKAYMHNRMRKQVKNWLQVLNRARPDPIAEKAKKTATGRTFVRK